MEEQTIQSWHHVVTIDDLGGLKRKVNVVFDNISVGGKIVTNLTDANIALGPYVHNVYFKVNGKAVNQEKGFCLDPNIIKLLTPVADCPLSEKNPN